MTHTAPSPARSAGATRDRDQAWLANSLTAQVQSQVVEALGSRVELGGPGDEATRVTAIDLAHQALAGINRGRIASGEIPLTEGVEVAVIDAVLDNIFGSGIFARYLRDDTVEDVVFNGPADVFVRRHNADWERAPGLEMDTVTFIEHVQGLAARAGRTERRFDTAAPILDLRLVDGSRLNAIQEVSGQPCVTLRRHRHVDITLDDLLRLGTIDKALHAFFTAAVAAQLNIVVTGEQASGKTTLMRALLAAIGPEARVVTIEDRLELHLSASPERFPNVVEMETRQANLEGSGEITMRQLVRNALTMSCDRIIIGEIRGDEILDMLTAMSVGARGSICTLHTMGSAEAVNRVTTLCALTPERLPREVTHQLLRDAVQLIIHVEKQPDGRRVVHSVREVTTYRDSDGLQTNEVFAPDHLGRACPAHPPEHRTLTRLLTAGFDDTVLLHTHGLWDHT